MENETAKAFRVASLSKYSFKDRLAIRLADWAFYLLILVIGRTIRFEVDGAENVTALEQKGKLPIYALWHDRIFAAAYFLRNKGIVVIASQSKDGEYIARFIQRFGFGAIRGSSNRGGVGALVEIIRMMRKGAPAAVTVDGPKGPRYEAKRGVVLLSKKTGNPIVPFMIETKRYYIAGSWDKMQIPSPFTRARVAFGEPIYVAPDSTDGELDEKQAELQISLDAMVSDGTDWRRSA